MMFLLAMGHFDYLKQQIRTVIDSVIKPSPSDSTITLNDGTWGIMVIDMQDWYLNTWDVAKRNTLIRSQINVLKYGVKNDIPIIGVRMRYELSIIPEILDVIRAAPRFLEYPKIANSAFSSDNYSPLDDLIGEKYGIKKLFMMGINAGSCFIGTARDAVELDYRVATSPELTDNCPHPTCESKESVLHWFEKRNGLVSPYTKLIE